MGESTHFNHGVEINLDFIAAGPEDISADDLTDEQLEVFQKSVLHKLSSMSPKEFFNDACSIFDTQASHASGWIIARQLKSGEIVVSRHKHEWMPVDDAIQNPDLYVHKIDPINPGKEIKADLPEEAFWLSYEEVLGKLPVFIVEAGANGPKINIGSWITEAGTWDVGEAFDEPGWFAKGILESLGIAKNPSNNDLAPEVREEGFQFDPNDLKVFLEAHRPDLAESIGWPDSPAP